MEVQDRVEHPERAAPGGAADCRESNARFRNLYDSAPTGFLTVDSDGLILEANRSISRILKISRDSLIGRRLSSFVAAHCQDRLRIALHELSEGWQRKDLMLEIALPESDAIELQLVAVPALRPT
jgi:PAS domain-containing protein